MKKIIEKGLNLVEKIINALEDSRLSVGYVIFTFLSAVTLRNFIEFFSNNTWIKESMLVHFYLSYIVLGMTLVVVFYFLTKENITKIFKLVFSGFIVLIIGPTIDLMITGGKGNHITYLMPEIHGNWEIILERFFTFFGKFQGIGVSPGLKIEIGLVLLLVVLYLYMKRLSWPKIILGTLSIYAVIFVYALSPYLMKYVFGWLNISFEYSETLFNNFYLLLILLWLVVLAFLKNRTHFRVLLKNIRFTRLMHYWLMFILGLVLVAGVKDQSFLTEENIFYIPFILVSILFAGIFSAATNDMADLEIDKISNRERPLVKSEISLANYKKIAGIALTLSLIYAAAVNFKVFFLMLFCIGNYFLYSMPPLRIKRIPLFSKTVILFNSLALVILGFNGLNNLNILYFLKFIQDFGMNFNNFSFLFGIFLFSWLLSINFIDLKDYAGDKKEGIKTLPVIFGLKASKIIIGLSAILFYSLPVFFLKNTKLSLVFIFVGFVQFYLLNRKKYQENIVFGFYLVSVAFLIILIWKF